MTTMAEDKKLTAAEREQVVIEGYQKGMKLTQIEQEAGISRATVYWILDKNGISPDRAHRRQRIVDVATVATLYELIQHQDARIIDLEAEMAARTAAYEERVAWLEAEVKKMFAVDREQTERIAELETGGAERQQRLDRLEKGDS